MIVKKKGLYLGLLLSMLGIGSAVQAYTVRIRNSTPYKIRFKVHYVSSATCYTIEKNLASGATYKKTKPFFQSGCLVKKVEATVYERPKEGPAVDKRAERYYATFGVAGNQTFIVAGPFGKGPGTFYEVTRKVN